MARNIAVSGVFSGVDHERIGSNETALRPVSPRSIILTSQDVPQDFTVISEGWGGECCAVFTIRATLLAKSNVGVTINGKFYEGDNESPDPSAVEDEKSDFVFVPKGGRPVQFSMNLYNDGTFGGGGDSANIDLTFTNTMVEEEDEAEPEPNPEGGVVVPQGRPIVFRIPPHLEEFRIARRQHRPIWPS
jgi:hypothetical protein